MSTSYDLYRELARTRAAAQGTLALEFVQTGLMANISGSLQSIHAEMQDVRRVAHEGLAVQQEMLKREIIQSRLEEFIYQMEKLVVEFSGENCPCSPSVRYFHLRGIRETVQKEGIGTPIIRGRENKQAFENALQRVNALTAQLQQVEEVKEAIAWAKAEQKRLADERQQQAAKSAAERDLRDRQIKETYERIHQLKSQRQGLAFVPWYKAKFKSVLAMPMPTSLLIQGAMWYFGLGFVWIPAWFFMEYFSTDKTRNAGVDGEIGALEIRLRELTGDSSLTVSAGASLKNSWAAFADGLKKK